MFHSSGLNKYRALLLGLLQRQDFDFGVFRVEKFFLCFFFFQFFGIPVRVLPITIQITKYYFTFQKHNFWEPCSRGAGARGDHRRNWQTLRLRCGRLYFVIQCLVIFNSLLPPWARTIWLPSQILLLCVELLFLPTATSPHFQNANMSISTLAPAFKLHRWLMFGCFSKWDIWELSVCSFIFRLPCLIMPDFVCTMSSSQDP